MANTNTANNFTVFNRQGSGPGYRMWGIHRTGCKDIELLEKRRLHSLVDGTADTLENAKWVALDEETRELGWTEEEIDIYPCCKQVNNAGNSPAPIRRNPVKKESQMANTKKATPAKQTTDVKDALAKLKKLVDAGEASGAEGRKLRRFLRKEGVKGGIRANLRVIKPTKSNKAAASSSK